MKSILYIGNKLRNKSSNVAMIHVLGELLTKEGYKLYYASSIDNKVFRLFDMIYTTLKHIRTIDVLIIDTYSTLNFYYAFIISQICRLFGKPYIPRLNGGNLPTRLKVNPRMSSMIFKNAKQNVSPSLYLKEAFETYEYNNITYIPNAIKINNYRVFVKDYNSIRLLWVRSFSKIYNPKMAVKVHKKLIDMGYASELCMIGPDSDGSLEDIKMLAKELNVDVEFTGKLTKEDWVSKSKKYNIFINTTNFDNMPVSVIEAMALGFPIISTNAGGMPFLIEDGKDGLLVDKNDTNAMVNAVIRIYEEQNLRENLILNAEKKVETFDWKVVRNQWNDLLS